MLLNATTRHFGKQAVQVVGVLPFTMKAHLEEKSVSFPASAHEGQGQSAPESPIQQRLLYLDCSSTWWQDQSSLLASPCWLDHQLALGKSWGHRVDTDLKFSCWSDDTVLRMARSFKHQWPAHRCSKSSLVHTSANAWFALVKPSLAHM